LDAATALINVTVIQNFVVTVFVRMLFDVSNMVFAIWFAWLERAVMHVVLSQEADDT